MTTNLQVEIDEDSNANCVDVWQRGYDNDSEVETIDDSREM